MNTINPAYNDNDLVVLVDEWDRELGFMDKLQAHREGNLHRAFSVFVFNDDGELLLQRRAENKYHSGGLWTNTCCSHPRPGESVEDAALRRLEEEMGFSCELEDAFSFMYQSDMGNGLTEYEYDHVLFGRFNSIPNPNPGEVSGWKYLSMERIERELISDARVYTRWFQICFSQVMAHFQASIQKKVG